MSAVLGWALEYIAEAILGRRVLFVVAVLVVLASLGKRSPQMPALKEVRETRQETSTAPTQERAIPPW